MSQQQTITAEVRNEDSSTFKQVIRPDSRYFNGDAHALCKDMFQNALVSVNKPIAKEGKKVKKNLEVVEES